MGQELVLREKQERETKIKKIDAALCEITTKDRKSVGLVAKLAFGGLGLLGLGLVAVSLFHLNGLWQLLALFPGLLCFLAPSGVLIFADQNEERMKSLVSDRLWHEAHLKTLRTPERLADRLIEINKEEERLKEERVKIEQEIVRRRGTPFRE